MALYTTIHLHNVPAGKEDAYAAWFEGPHREALARLRGLRWAERFEVAPEQIMRDIPQPWHFMSVYDFDYSAPEIDLPALAPLIRRSGCTPTGCMAIGRAARTGSATIRFRG